MSRSYLPHWMHWLGSPPNFYRFAGAWRPWLMATALIAGVIGLYGGLVLAPPDYQQGDAYRIIFIHVPSAWMSLFIYASMAVAGLVALVWRVKLAEVVAMECAPVGAAFTFITLVTGSLWGKPMWGTWWVWDARLTTSLLLLFLYLGYLALLRAHEGRASADRPCAVLGLLGALNLPVIYFSVHWWNTLHQGASITTSGASMPGATLAGLLLMTGAAWGWTFAVAFKRVQLLIKEREAHTRWLHSLQADEQNASYSIAAGAHPASAGGL